MKEGLLMIRFWMKFMQMVNKKFLCLKSYSAILNFYENENVFDMRPANKINFKCLICKKVLKAKVWRFTNLNRHIVQDHKDNKQTVEWCTKYIIKFILNLRLVLV